MDRATTSEPSHPLSPRVGRSYLDPAGSPRPAVRHRMLRRPPAGIDGVRPAVGQITGSDWWVALTVVTGTRRTRSPPCCTSRATMESAEYWSRPVNSTNLLWLHIATTQLGSSAAARASPTRRSPTTPMLVEDIMPISTRRLRTDDDLVRSSPGLMADRHTLTQRRSHW